MCFYVLQAFHCSSLIVRSRSVSYRRRRTSVESKAPNDTEEVEVEVKQPVVEFKKKNQCRCKLPISGMWLAGKPGKIAPQGFEEDDEEEELEDDEEYEYYYEDKNDNEVVVG